MRPGYVYIMASGQNGTLYIGVASDLPARVYHHRNDVVEGFTKQYGCKYLVWYEAHENIQDARASELRMKKWNRAWKLRAIEMMNPGWNDLSESLA